MPFMVIYRTSDGTSRYEQADAIDEAALFVERLRNSEGIDQIRIYRMEEISFAFRPYYKVELGLQERPASPPTEGTRVPEVSDRQDGLAEAPAADADAAPDTEVILDAPMPVVEPAADHPSLPPVAAASTLPPPPGGDSEIAGANGRRGLFGR